MIIKAASESILRLISFSISLISVNLSLLSAILVAPSPGGGQRPLTIIWPPFILVPISDAASPMMTNVPPSMPAPARFPAEPRTTTNPPDIPAPVSAPDDA